MEGDAVAPDRDFLTWCLQQPPVPPDKLATLCPDFLVISPPKTGSSWLAANLRCHPQVFVPTIKEVKYFNPLGKWLDLNWYLDQFRPAAGRVKGEATPSYALLPVPRIRLIRRLMPEVKLIFLMRDPLARAWSHAKHNYRFKEASFAGCGTPFEAITDSQWRENLTHAWPLVSGDYLGQLRRWLSLFPRAQLYVGFYESIARSPETLLRDLFAFLGVNPDVDLSPFRVSEKVLPGLVGELPPVLEKFLHRLLHDRTRELASFLRAQFGLEPPPEWKRVLEPAARTGPPVIAAGACLGAAAVFNHEFDDRYLAQVLQQEEALSAGPYPVLEGYRGYDIVFSRGRLVALEQNLGPLAQREEVEIQRYQDESRCFIAPSLAEVKERVDQYVFSRTQDQLRDLESLQADLHDARAHLSRLEGGLLATVAALQKIEADVTRPYRWLISLAHLLRNSWRRLRAFFRKRSVLEAPSPNRTRGTGM